MRRSLAHPRGIVSGVSSNYPRTLQVMVTIHGLCIAFLAISVSSIRGNFVPNVKSEVEACLHLPNPLSESCICSELEPGPNGDEGGVELACKRLNSTDTFNLDSSSQPEEVETNDINDIHSNRAQNFHELLRQNLKEILIRDSDLKVLKLSDFSVYPNLRKLSVVQSSVMKVDNSVLLPNLVTLDLSGNKLRFFALDFQRLPRLQGLNLSHNAIQDMEPKWHETRLITLDLSSNHFDEDIKPQIFTSLPATLQSLDISDNEWICAPKLSWVHSWSEPFLKAAILKNVSGTRCRYMDSKYDGQLFLVMEYYSKYVIPSCPTKDNCSCALTSVQEKLVHARERFYSVEVSCVGGGLSHFPKLPKHTRTVDLSQNKLNSRSFSFLKVEEHNYKDVDNLTLDKNRLQTLPEKLLDMKLGLSFSAKYNNLTSIPYDFSQRLMKTTAVIKMSNNPWTCTCTSEVTDLNLLVKIRDRDEMTCGPASDIQLKSKQITLLSPEMLCPPETTGEFQELLLQVLCVILALLIVLVLARLAYDYWIYRTKGQLPWLALKMH
ncbi:hypothetical protein TCAL_07683 [Tigriopus californicus]|uniref:LRRCT domain-containing protein n=2 Tax=Tigriopus californicus TaxID=6832 RepID=A0A553NTA6_TIGCA|nr:protein singed wings 2-like isoform X2 [Tigriopus californicus]XP_059086085.1 protein singed wings 2-like isoform X2 [Tigriopus californicus]TRY68648.1 hypothetical protein TCAL_07683 [Tigriopus californicus]|eukprot:TCALIF_07683-PA protein Name:"Similar to hfw Protein halfway (Drosophila pseudoobscura pseudoobscura)" AED:0.07 eAED:0.07 QI:550/0.83/0.71/1/0.83/0.85/7/262/548